MNTTLTGSVEQDAVSAPFELAPELAVSVDVIDTETGLLSLHEAWEELFQCNLEPSCYLHWEWLVAWWNQFGRVCPSTGAVGKLHVVVMRSAGRVVAIYPFYSRKRGLRVFALNRLLPLGYNGVIEPSGLTEEPMCLVRPGYEVSSNRQLLQHLRDLTNCGKCECAVFNYWDKGDGGQVPVHEGWQGISYGWQKRRNGPRVAPLAEDWAKFRKSLTKSMRDNLPYYPKLLNRAGHTWNVEFHRTDEEIRTACAELIRLHKKRVFSTVGEIHDDYFPTQAAQDLLVEGCTALARRNAAFLASLVVDGETIAVQAYLERAPMLTVFYSGFAPEWARFSPLLVVQSEVFRQAMERGIRKMDMLTGGALWQKRWKAEPEGKLVRTYMLRATPLTMIRAAVYVSKRETLSLVRRLGIRTRIRRMFANAQANALISTTAPQAAFWMLRFAHWGSHFHRIVTHAYHVS